MVQWIRPRAPNAGDLGLIPGQGTSPTCMPQLRVCMPQLRSLPAATKTQCNQINNFFLNYLYGQFIFTKNAKTIQWGKNSIFNKCC